MIDNCTSHGSSQTGGDEGVTGEETEGKRKSERKEKTMGCGGWEGMIGDIC